MSQTTDIKYYLNDFLSAIYYRSDDMPYSEITALLEKGEAELTKQKLLYDGDDYWTTDENKDIEFKQRIFMFLEQRIEQDFLDKRERNQNMIGLSSKNFLDKFMKDSTHRFELCHYLSLKDRLDNNTLLSIQTISSIYGSPLDKFMIPELRAIVNEYAGPVIEVPLIVSMAVLLQYFLVNGEKNWRTIGNRSFYRHDINNIPNFFAGLNEYIRNSSYAKYERNAKSDNWNLNLFLNGILVLNRDTRCLGGNRCEDITRDTMVSLGHVLDFVHQIYNIQELWEFVFR